MNDFTIRLRLETPMFLGGPLAGEVDRRQTLREASIRGLLHTFARALLGPLLNQDIDETRKAEMLLLGSAGGDGGQPPTFRLQAERAAGLSTEVFPVLPHTNQGRRAALAPDQETTLTIRPRPWVIRDLMASPDDPGPQELFLDAFWSLCWAAFAFGSLGSRSRRGFGSLRILEMRSLQGGIHNSPAPTLPTWSDPPDDGPALLIDLSEGFQTVREVLSNWLTANGFAVQPNLEGAIHSFFQMQGEHQIFIGEPAQAAYRTGDEDELLPRIMHACHEAKRDCLRNFVWGLGRVPEDRKAVPDSPTKRMASPLWIRVYGTQVGYVPVCIFSRRMQREEEGDDNRPKEASRIVLKRLGCPAEQV